LAIAAMALRLGGLAATVPRIFVVGTLALLSRPGQANLIGGQVAATATVACYTALWWSRSRPWLAATGLAVATFKPTFGGPLGLLMLARGDGGVVLRGLALAAAATAWPALTAPPPSPISSPPPKPRGRRVPRMPRRRASAASTRRRSSAGSSGIRRAP